MTHNILGCYAHKPGKSSGLAAKLDEDSGTKVRYFYQGKGQEHGYYVYDADRLKEHFVHHNDHPHNIEPNPLQNRADDLARLVNSRGTHVFEIGHISDSPKILTDNYTRFRVYMKKEDAEAEGRTPRNPTGRKGIGNAV
jgi:hypothetical protein